MTTIKILRRTSRGRDYLGSLYVRVIHERRVSTLTLPIRLYGNEWDSRNECVSYQGSDTYRQRELTMVSTQLRQVREQFSDILNKLESSGAYHSRDLIRLYRWRSNKKACGISQKDSTRSFRNEGRNVQPVLIEQSAEDWSISVQLRNCTLVSLLLDL